ncbi:MAG: AAA family ATPase, partial [Tumebacillaceae bacterium]
MRLLRAKIDGFGRYSDRFFTFADGLNVVYGKNEAGKSTLQQFLLAMLYGMKKPGRKRSIYLEEEAKYRPWQSGAYGGVLWLEVEGVEYRIERSLRRDDEWVRIFRQDTGEELTSRFPVDSRKEVAFARTLIGADREQFLNTLCIGPIDERQRVHHLRESVRQSDGGSGDTLSTPEQSQIRVAQEALQKRLEALGTERAGTKPLGMALKLRDDLQRAYLEAWQREDSQKEARTSAEQEAVEWQEAVRDEQLLREEFRSQLARYLRVQQARRGELLGRIDLLERALAERRAEEADEIDDTIFREMQQDLQKMLTRRQEFESYQKRLDVVEAESREAKAFTAKYEHISESFLQEVEHTAYLLELYEQKAQKEEQPTFDPQEFAAMEVTQRGQKRKLWMFGGAAVLVIPFCFSQWWAIGLFVVFLILASLSYVSAQKLSEKMERWEEARQDAEATLAADRAEQERLEARLLKLLSDFEVDTPRQYRQKWSGL